MAQLVCMGALLQCQYGSLPAPLSLLPDNKVSGLTPFANINNHIPILNTIPFGMCSCPNNPAVIIAQGAPVPCTAATASAWTQPANKVKVGGAQGLTKDSQLRCLFGGQITINLPGQLTVSGQ